jgi:hypothetical protein
MSDLMAPCGLDCSKCGAYIARKNNDDALRKSTAEEWSKIHNVEIKPEEVNCDGCLTDSECKIGHCNVCEIRNCSFEKALTDCNQCSEYKCAIHVKYFG